MYCGVLKPDLIRQRRNIQYLQPLLAGTSYAYVVGRAIEKLDTTQFCH